VDRMGDRARIDELLADARAQLPQRVQADELDQVMADGALVVDTRSEAQRRRDGELPGAVVVERNVLEWRVDPTSDYRLPAVTGPDQVIVAVCDEGFASSLAGATRQDLGPVNPPDPRRG